MDSLQELKVQQRVHHVEQEQQLIVQQHQVAKRVLQEHFKTRTHPQYMGVKFVLEDFMNPVQVQLLVNLVLLENTLKMTVKLSHTTVCPVAKIAKKDHTTHLKDKVLVVPVKRILIRRVSVNGKYFLIFSVDVCFNIIVVFMRVLFSNIFFFSISCYFYIIF